MFDEQSKNYLLELDRQISTENDEYLLEFDYSTADLASLGKKYFLSKRSQHILGRINYSKLNFINLSEYEISHIRNCGAKTTKELLQFQKDILKDHRFNTKSSSNLYERKVLEIEENFNLSNRAKNIITKMGLSVKEFIELSKSELFNIRNCGIKTSRELLNLQNKLILYIENEKQKYTLKEGSLLSEIYEFQELSPSAQHVLKDKKVEVSHFLKLTSSNIYRIGDCAPKISEELIKFQYKLKIKKEEYISLELDSHFENKLKETYLCFSKPVKNCIETIGLDIKNPLSWNLEDHKDRYPVGSKIIKILSEYKTLYFQSCHREINYGELSADLTLLPEYYKKYKDLPFVASLFKVDIHEAARQVRSIRKIVRQAIEVKFNSLHDELEYLLPSDKRNKEICLNRLVPWGGTLEEIGTIYGVTRERIRQIELKTKKNIAKRYEICRNEIEYIHKEATSLLSIGESISIELLRQKYHDDNILNAVIGIILSISKDSKDFSEVYELIKEIPKKSSMNIRQNFILIDISSDTVRKIRRIVLNSGAIHTDQIKQIASISKEDISIIMVELRYKEIEDNWYSFDRIDLGKRLPLLNSLVKILNANPEVAFKKAYLGMQRHADRFNFILPPQNIMKRIMQDYSCIISDSGKIKAPIEYQAEYSGVEKLYVNYLRNEGPLVTFWDLYQGIVEKGGYSFPALSSSLLRTSPIVEKIDSDRHISFFTVIGWEFKEEDKERAISRMPEVKIDIGFKRTLNGVSLELSLGLWFVTSGVLCITGYDVPEGEWNVEIDFEDIIRIVVNENFIYGLSKLVKSMNLQIGERISLEFNTLKKEIYIKRITA